MGMDRVARYVYCTRYTYLCLFYVLTQYRTGFLPRTAVHYCACRSPLKKEPKRVLPLNDSLQIVSFVGLTIL